MKNVELKRFAGFMKKEFLHIFRDPRTFVILFGMPIIQILLFGYAITNEIRDANIVICDQSKDEVTSAITTKILSSGYFKLNAYINDINDIENIFKQGKVKLIIIYESNFGSTLNKSGIANVRLIADATDANTGTTLVYYAGAIISNYIKDINKNYSLPLNITNEARLRYNPEIKGAYLFVPGLLTIIMMLVSAMMTSISLTREKELGSFELLLASPIKPGLVIVAKVAPYLVLSFVIVSVILTIGQLVFGVPMLGSYLFLAFECTLFVITALSLGILISTIAESQQVALMLSLVGLMLPTILLSGFIFPIQNMPLWLQWFSLIIPARWFIVIVRDIMLKGNGIEYLWKETLILVGFVIFFIALSIKKYKVRL